MTATTMRHQPSRLLDTERRKAEKREAEQALWRWRFEDGPELTARQILLAALEYRGGDQTSLKYQQRIGAGRGRNDFMRMEATGDTYLDHTGTERADKRVVYPAAYEQAIRLEDRWRQWQTWPREGRHEWTHEQTIHYADNSTAVRERSTLTGEVRERMTIAPGGDACF